MEANYQFYDYEKSVERIQEIIDGSDASYEDKDYIPSKDDLTFNNGYYVNGSAIFVDMRGSKELANKHTRPVLAKIYKAYISELIAVMRGATSVKEIYIEGDCVWAVFDTPMKNNIDDVFEIAVKARSLVDILNVKLIKKAYSAITVGVGVSYGSSLIIKSGYKGSGVNEIVWLGKLVGEAAKLCSYGSKTYGDYPLMLSSVFRDNMKDEYRDLLSWNAARGCYHSNSVSSEMNKWVKENE